MTKPSHQIKISIIRSRDEDLGSLQQRIEHLQRTRDKRTTDRAVRHSLRTRCTRPANGEPVRGKKTSTPRHRQRERVREMAARSEHNVTLRVNANDTVTRVLVGINLFLCVFARV